MKRNFILLAALAAPLLLVGCQKENIENLDEILADLSTSSDCCLRFIASSWPSGYGDLSMLREYIEDTYYPDFDGNLPKGNFYYYNADRSKKIKAVWMIQTQNWRCSFVDDNNNVLFFGNHYSTRWCISKAGMNMANYKTHFLLLKDDFIGELFDISVQLTRQKIYSSTDSDYCLQFSASVSSTTPGLNDYLGVTYYPDFTGEVPVGQDFYYYNLDNSKIVKCTWVTNQWNCTFVNSNDEPIFFGNNTVRWFLYPEDIEKAGYISRIWRLVEDRAPFLHDCWACFRNLKVQSI